MAEAGDHAHEDVPLADFIMQKRQNEVHKLLEDLSAGDGILGFN